VGFEEFEKRSDMYLKRSEALEKAQVQARRIMSALGLGTIVVFVTAVIVLWSILSVKVLFGISAGVFVLRWIANMIVHLKFTKPTMARIDREFPLPAKRPPP